MVVFKFVGGSQAQQVKDAQGPFDSHQGNTEHTLGVAGVGSRPAEDRRALPQGTLHNLATDFYLRGGSAFPMPNATGTGLFVGMAQDHDGTGICRDYFTDQLQQALLQRRDVANRVDGVGNLEQRVKIAGHTADIGARMRQRRKSPDVGRGQKVDWLFFSELDDLRNMALILRNEEDQFAAADPNGVSMGQQFTSHRNAIDEGAVVTLEVKQLESGIDLADGEMTSRYRAIAQAQVIG